MASSVGGEESSPARPILLHGDLDLLIIKARLLPNKGTFSDHIRRCFATCVPKQAHPTERRGGDRYVTLSAGAIVARTAFIPVSQRPRWAERFFVPLAHRADMLEFQVKDSDTFGAQVIGAVLVPADQVVASADEEVDGWFPLVGPSGKPYKPRTELHLRFRFCPLATNPMYRHGIPGHPEQRGVQDSYFPLRHGGRVTLYQDAHVNDGDLPDIELEPGKLFQHNHCWEDICHAILEAHHMIYIVGWSIYDKVKLVREPSSSRPLPEGGDLTLGELLKFKSQEYVTVCLLVWDDSSQGGVMGTHDEETRKFFKHSSVTCVLSPRDAGSKVVGALFTHNQKCVLVDTEAWGNKRKVTAFIGGLDLCDGRYDTPEHRVFKDIDTVFENDYHNPSFSGSAKGPRKPWHDLHCKIDGPAAYDVLKNFEQRWRKVYNFRDGFREVSRREDYGLIRLEHSRWVLSPSPIVPNDHVSLWVSKEEDPENWHVQVFRSIDSGSPTEFHSNSKETSKQLIGTVLVPADQVVASADHEVEGWFPIVGPSGKPYKPPTALHLRFRFRPLDANPMYRRGIPADPKRWGVQDSYFPLRHGGKVTLYQKAHVNEGGLPDQCWEDICHAILEAHHMIYIVGWSIYDKVKLVREPSSSRPLPKGGELTLGELLKFKSQEGTRVCLLIWDDKTSNDKLFIKTGGVMGTHDEETRKFFKHSSVTCALSPRYASSKLSIFKQQVVGTLFTHHKKCLLVDTQAWGNKRKVIAFVGGLDLCDGRDDTLQYRLFKGLDTVFENEYHNPTFSGSSKGPRQPWHDLHCKIDGPAAYDLLKNFEQRWRKTSKFHGFRKVSRWEDDALIKLERISWILSPSSNIPNNHVSLGDSKEEDPENWHVQVFRSIDSGSVKGFPKGSEEASKQNLVCRKDLIIDKSIHTAYVQAIRSAQHFIYIENQYFLGSSYAWPSYVNSGADNLIPMELALKIASKIRAGERFAVYVVIPMWPEGVPTAASVQEILYFQAQTMEMMYRVVAQELKAMNIENANLQDYLNFYCLGNREESSTNGLARKYRRFMIYVHAKGMIVDDEYVILGSANINQRSLAGSRDTEIAMGAYQPRHSWSTKGGHPRGQVYGYRTSLWAEHLGVVDERFKDPASLDCVRLVNQIAKENWEIFRAEKMKTLQGHLLRYPVKIEPDGKIGPLPDQECFPDMGGEICGAPTSLPDSLTV